MYDVTKLVGLPPEFRLEEAAAAGVSRKVLARMVRNGHLVRVNPGLFRRRASAWGDEHAERWPRWQSVHGDHLSRLRVALLAHPQHAASHLSAAVLRGWPVRLHPETLVHLTAIEVQPRSRRVADRLLHHSDSLDNEVEVVDGARTLLAARTVADCLRSMPPPASVAVADAAVREGSATRADIEEVLAAQRRWVGRPKAYRCLPLVDPRRESWLESYSFVRLSELGVELPTPQVEIFTASGRFVGRVDGMWIDDATVAEADGTAKYLMAGAGDVEGTATGETAARRVAVERHREQALRDLGLEVVRWTTEEIVADPASVVRRIAAARAVGSRGRFVGRLRLTRPGVRDAAVRDTVAG